MLKEWMGSDFIHKGCTSSCDCCNKSGISILSFQQVTFKEFPCSEQPAVFPESSELIIQTSVVDFFTSAIPFRIFYLFWGEITNYHLRSEAVEKMALWAKYRGKKYENAGLP